MTSTTELLDVDDVLADCYALYHVIDAAAVALCEMDFTVDGKRNRQLERVDGLVQAARRLAESIREKGCQP